MTTRADTLVTRGSQLFSDKSSLNSLHQEIADNFYPERADFTRSRYLGQDFASNLMSSYPVVVRREMGNAISSILRPSELEWFDVTIEEPEGLDKAGKEYLEYIGKVMRRAMYDRTANFVRATKEGDQDFASFGQCVLSLDFDPKNNSLLYRSWHLRDAAWTESYNGSIGEIHLNWKPTINDLVDWFGRDKLHQKVVEAYEKEPNKRIPCRRVVLPADNYHMPGNPWQHPWVSVYVDLDNNHPIEEMAIRTRGHIIPRWQTVSGSQYAYSPATVAGLPDARLIQAMTLTLLEAGEMAVRPPMLASGDHFREDLANFAGGLTFIDGEYDKRKMDVLRPLNQDKSGLPFGMDFSTDVKEMLAAAFYLNKLTLPPADRDMTAYETSERIKEYIRAARPLFEPMEYEYNYGLCDATFEELMGRGAFGAIHQIPESLQGRDIQYSFESPLHQAVERQEGVTFLEASELLRTASEIDGAASAVLDIGASLRGALKSIRTPETWIREEEEVAEIANREAEMQQIERAAQVAGQGAQAAQQLEEASSAL